MDGGIKNVRFQQKTDHISDTVTEAPNVTIIHCQKDENY